MQGKSKLKKRIKESDKISYKALRKSDNYKVEKRVRKEKLEK